MKPRRWLLLLIPAAAAAALAWRTLRPKDVKVEHVTRGTSISAVYASGAVEPFDRVDVAARLSGPIVELPFREGDAVKQGDLLARVDAPTLGHDVTRAQAESSAASARLGVGPAIESLKGHRAALSAQLVQARADLTRVENLARSGSTSSAELDRVRAQVDFLRAQIGANEAQERDLRIALLADAQRQRALLDTARSRFDDAEVRAPLTGTVMSRRVELGQVVATHQVLLRVGDLSRLHLEVDVDESDIALVRVGQPSVVRLYAMRGKILSGRVAKIHPEADRARKTFKVELDLEDKVDGVYPGMTAEVNIVLSRHDDVLLAPLEALRGDRVWVVEDGRAQMRTVTVKQQDLSRAEVEGLPEGAEVIVGDDTGLAPGARVRPSVAEGSAGAGRPEAPARARARR